MKILLIIGWSLFALEVIFAITLIVIRNAGDDAAGRGVAAAYGIVLLLALLVVGGVLAYGTFAHSKAASWIGLILAAVPFLVALMLGGSSKLKELEHSLNRAKQGRFSDPQMTKVARAIDAHDYAAVRQLTQAQKFDWTLRDSWDATLLGHAIRRVLEDYTGDPPVEAVRILLANGAPVSTNDIRTNDLLMQTIATDDRPGSMEVLKALLDAGADPNACEKDGLPLILDCKLPAIKILAEHGADVRVLSNRTDRKDWTTMMNAAYMGNWDEALFFLEQGVPADYRAPDGNDVFSIVKARAQSRKQSGSTTPEPGSEAFLAALKQKQP